MSFKFFRSKAVRTLVATGALLSSTFLHAQPCEIYVEGTSIRGGDLCPLDGPCLEIKNALLPDGTMGANYGLAERFWELSGCMGYLCCIGFSFMHVPWCWWEPCRWAPPPSPSPPK